MNGQRDIFGRELEGEAPEGVASPSHEVLPLFSAPQTMRGQLSAWAESVCDEVERPAGRLDEWAREVVQPLHGVQWSGGFAPRGKYHVSTEHLGETLCGYEFPQTHNGRGNCSVSPENMPLLIECGRVCKRCLKAADDAH